MTTLADIQRHVGVTPDGLWGTRTSEAIADALGMPKEPVFDPAPFYAAVKDACPRGFPKFTSATTKP